MQFLEKTSTIFLTRWHISYFSKFGNYKNNYLLPCSQVFIGKPYIRESLRLLQKQNMLKEIRRNELRRKIMPGVEQIRNGEDIELRMPEDFAKFTEQIIVEASEERAKSQAK